MTSMLIADPLPPGEWERHPASLAEDAFQDGWTQRLGGAPATYPRQLNSGELTAWTRGHAAAQRALMAGEAQRLATPDPQTSAHGSAPRPAAELEVPAPVATTVGARPLVVADEPRLDDEAVPRVELELKLKPPAAPAAPHFDGTQVCAQVDPELFFPEKGGVHGVEAKKLCVTCEFRQACLDYALNERINGMPIAGIWGGTTGMERRNLRRAEAAGNTDPAAVALVEDLLGDLDDLLDEEVA